MPTPVGRARQAGAAAIDGVVALGGVAGARADEGVEYRWEATLDRTDDATLAVEGVVRVRNDAAVPLLRVPLVLYPNRFRRDIPSGLMQR